MGEFSTSQTLITGVYRTGSEYFTHLIGEHPRLSAGMYKINALRYLPENSFCSTDFDTVAQALNNISNRLASRYGESLDVPAIMSLLGKEKECTFGRIYDATMSHVYLSNTAADNWVEKNQLIWREIPKFLNMLDNPRAIIIIRDPRAVLASFKYFTIATEPGYLTAVFNCFDCLKHTKKYVCELPKDKFLIVKNEDLMLRPTECAKRSWRFIGVDPNFELSTQASWMDAHGNAWCGNSSFSTAVDNRSNKAKMNQWKTALNDDEVAFAELICGELMLYFGYELTTNQKLHNEIRQPFQKQVLENAQLKRMYENWLSFGEGAQEFPENT